MVADVTLNLPNSRTHEVEADRMGVELAARAGYDPRAAISLWEKMAKNSSGGQPPKWLSTHPSHEDRISDLRTYAAKRSEEHTSELQSPCKLVCRLLLAKKKKNVKRD